MKENFKYLRLFNRYFLLALLSLFFVDSLLAQVQVRGYYKKDGTYVKPHVRTYPDGNPYNNYSFPGNYNPNTGKITPGNPETYLRNYYNRNRTTNKSYNYNSNSLSLPRSSNSSTYSSYSQRNVVSSVQSALNILGYSAGSTDGIYGPRTKSALNVFQKDKGLNVTDNISNESIEKLINELSSYSARSENTSIPPNAYANSWGSGWSCIRGYKKVGNGCEKVTIPQNAQLNYYGNGWTCKRGYKKVGNRCQEVFIPQNAQLNYYGNGWVCNRGYKKVGNGCEKVAIPLNAQLNYYGNGWTCNRGYKKIGNRCEKVAIPQNAQLNYYGNGWVCNRGYKRVGDSCERIIIPANAQLNYYGNGWVCNNGYKQINNRCVLN